MGSEHGKNMCWSWCVRPDSNALSEMHYIMTLCSHPE
uniref:Uncharacterized protein n=1 Tax=Anguilla anguilla TaxID=7936 RepID=A0A0E9UDQ3_ANGAN